MEGTAGGFSLQPSSRIIGPASALRKVEARIASTVAPFLIRTLPMEVAINSGAGTFRTRDVGVMRKPVTRSNVSSGIFDLREGSSWDSARGCHSSNGHGALRGY